MENRLSPPLEIVPSNIRLAVTAERMITEHFRERRLHTHLQDVENRYEYILMDCPPNLGVLAVNAIYTADLIIIPVTYGRYSLDGTADLLDSIGVIREGGFSSWLILRNAFDARNRATNAYVNNELVNVDGHLMETIIRPLGGHQPRRRYGGNRCSRMTQRAGPRTTLSI